MVMLTLCQDEIQRNGIPEERWTQAIIHWFKECQDLTYYGIWVHESMAPDPPSTVIFQGTSDSRVNIPPGQRGHPVYEALQLQFEAVDRSTEDEELQCAVLVDLFFGLFAIKQTTSPTELAATWLGLNGS